MMMKKIIDSIYILITNNDYRCIKSNIGTYKTHPDLITIPSFIISL